MQAVADEFCYVQQLLHHELIVPECRKFKPRRVFDFVLERMIKLRIVTVQDGTSVQQYSLYYLDFPPQSESLVDSFCIDLSILNMSFSMCVCQYGYFTSS